MDTVYCAQTGLALESKRKFVNVQESEEKYYSLLNSRLKGSWQRRRVSNHRVMQPLIKTMRNQELDFKSYENGP